MLKLILLTASLLPSAEVQTFAYIGDAPHRIGRGVLVTGDNWQASVYVDGDYSVVTDVHYHGYWKRRAWTR